MNRFISAAAALALACLLAPSPASARVLWKGDFESGDLSQWTRAQIMNGDRFKVIDTPVRSGRYAAKVTVKRGDDPINSSGNRNEVLHLTFEPKGSERWYRFSTMFDPSFPSAET
ncbi:MAG: heparin lyase I family protein, partial [Myxococcales bacterium]